MTKLVRSNFSKWRNGVLVLTTTSTCLWFNSHSCPITGTRRLDFFSNQELRERSCKVLLETFEEREHVEVAKKELGISYKEMLTQVMVEEFIQKEDDELVPKSDSQYSRVAMIADRLVQSNEMMDLEYPEFHIVANKHINAFSIARHIIITMGTLNRWNDSQVAFIIGHEMAHHVLDHHLEGLSFFCLDVVVLLYHEKDVGVGWLSSGFSSDHSSSLSCTQ